MKCFSFKELNFKNGIFDNSIDCSYIIHLEDNTNRLKNIKIQLNKFKPTSKIYIYNNKGFKKCKKNLYKQKTNYDIIHSYIEIFKHAQLNNYNNIFIFEDDFILDRLFLKEDINNINNFCNENKHKKFTLSLGILPVLYYPKNYYFKNILLGVSMHNTIFSKNIRDYILKNTHFINKVGDWDVYNNTLLCRYFYYKPLIYQKFEETENQKNWPLSFFGIKYIILKYMKFIDFNNNPKRAFQIHYKIAMILNIFIILLILFIIYYFVTKS
tara:strand:- start:426 stop:1232 length:807 start_codon:yes stop_codon:yes gene_type:complete